MHYDFDTMMNRRGTGSVKWDVPEGDLPMWVADMDFQTAPEIMEALRNRIDHGIFGYTVVSQEWYEAICSWWESRHHFRPKKEWLVFCNGVISAIDTAVRQLTEPGDQILVLSPTYNHFFISIEDNQRVALESQLIYSDGKYTIDETDFTTKLADDKTKILLLSNPQNPTGNIWDKETLELIGQLCEKHHVLIISDEIHCALTDPGYEYVPFASVSTVCAENSITCIAPTKAFNMAGLQTAAIIVPNVALRERMKKGLSLYGAAQPNALAIEAAVAAFTKGGSWLDALRAYLAENKAFAHEYLEEHLPHVKAVTSHATYLMWLDFSQVTEDSKALCKWIRKKTGLFMNIGKIYRGNGDVFARLNLGCSRAVLEDGLARLVKGVKSYEQRIEGVVFDMDGLLLDTEQIVKRTWTEIGREIGYSDMGEQIYHTVGFNRARRKIYFQNLYGEDFPHDEVVKMTTVRFEEIVEREGLPIKPGVYELLAAIKAKGCKIGLATSSSEEHAVAELKEAGIYEYFDGCVFGEMVTRSKPDKEVYEKACSLIGVEPKLALALEDAPSGIQSAHSAGLRVIMIPDLVQPMEEIRQLTWDVKSSLNDVIEIIEEYA